MTIMITSHLMGTIPYITDRRAVSIESIFDVSIKTFRPILNKKV